MKKVLLFAATAALIGAGCSSTTNSSANSDIELRNCAIQQTIPGAKATGAFLNIHKNDSSELSLVSAAAPSITEHVEIHEMIMKDGTMKMSQIPSYPLKAGDNIFQKGGYHIMLMDLQKPLAVGETRSLVFNFSDGSSKSCVAEVKSVEALTPKGKKMHQHGDGKMHSH